MVAADGGEAQTEETPVQGDATDDETVSTTIPMSASGGKPKKRKKKKTKKPSVASSPRLPDDVSSYWSTDKFKVSNDPGAGRCLMATRNLPAGDLLFEELPFAKAGQPIVMTHLLGGNSIDIEWSNFGMSSNHFVGLVVGMTPPLEMRSSRQPKIFMIQRPDHAPPTEIPIACAVTTSIGDSTGLCAPLLRGLLSTTSCSYAYPDG